MLFKKKRVKKVKLAEVESWLKEVESDWASKVDHLQKTLESVNATPDLGERYIALDEFEKMLPKTQERYIDETSKSLPLSFKETAKTFFESAINIYLSSIAGGPAIILIYAALSAAPVTLAGIIAALGGGGLMLCGVGHIMTSDKKRAIFKSHLSGMEPNVGFRALTKNVKQSKQDLLKNHVLDFGSSSKFDVLYDEYPDVKKAFVQSTMQKSTANFPSQPKIKTKTISSVRKTK